MISQKDSHHMYRKYNHHFFLANIVFGMPSKRCLFHGICQLDIVTNFEKNLSVNQAYAILTKNTDHTLDICFVLDSMNHATIKKHFFKQQFRIMEDKIVNKRIERILGIKAILKGLYPVTTEEECLKITVPIRLKTPKPKVVSSLI